MAASQRNAEEPRPRKRRRREKDEEIKGGDPDLGTPLQRPEGLRRTSQLLSLHRARFVDWEPTAVTALAASSDGTVLAVARDSGVLELWETEHWTCLTTLLGSRDLAVTSLAWLQGDAASAWRLYSGGLDGSLTEWDILARKPKHRTDALGGAVWAMAAQPVTAEGGASRLAVACDDGCLRLFCADKAEQGLLYEGSMPSLKHRLLSVAWHPNAKSLVTGTSDGSLHAWDVGSKREILRVHTGDERKKRHDVWAVAVLADGTMVTGDGGGNVQFWSAAHGTLISSHRFHIAAVLAVAGDPNGSLLFAAGIDHRIAVFQKMEADGVLPLRWQYLEAKRPHTHDVRALAVVVQPDRSPLLITGGNDAHLYALRIPNFSQERPFRLTAAPEAPCIQMGCSQTGASPLLLAIQRENADLWRLGMQVDPLPFGYGPIKRTSVMGALQHLAPGRDKQLKEGQVLDVAEMPEHLGRLTTSERSRILTAAISDDGSLVALADALETHLYALEALGEPKANSPGKALQLKRRRLPQAYSGTTALGFCGKMLLMADKAGTVTIVDSTAGKEVGRIAVPNLKGQRGSGAACSEPMAANLQLIGSPGGRFAALLRPLELHLLDLEMLSYCGRISNREGSGPNTTAAFCASSDLLAIAAADNSLALYSVPSKKPFEAAEGWLAALYSRLSEMSGTISGISFLPDTQRRAAFITTPSSICFADFDAALLPWRPQAQRRRRRSRNRADSIGTNGRVIKLVNVCLAFAFTATDAAVLVEKDWSSVADRFPPPIYRHRYGS